MNDLQLAGRYQCLPIRWSGRLIILQKSTPYICHGDFEWEKPAMSIQFFQPSNIQIYFRKTHVFRLDRSSLDTPYTMRSIHRDRVMERPRVSRSVFHHVTWEFPLVHEVHIERQYTGSYPLCELAIGCKCTEILRFISNNFGWWPRWL
jgi:hypothetical protein